MTPLSIDSLQAGIKRSGFNDPRKVEGRAVAERDATCGLNAKCGAKRIPKRVTTQELNLSLSVLGRGLVRKTWVHKVTIATTGEPVTNFAEILSAFAARVPPHPRFSNAREALEARIVVDVTPCSLFEGKRVGSERACRIRSGTLRFVLEFPRQREVVHEPHTGGRWQR
jgi:hypothetical protein